MAWVVETFGRYDKVLEPGLRFLIPLVQRVSYVFSLKEEAISVPSQTAITRDNVSVSIDGVLFVKVTDAYRAAYGVEDPHFAVTQLAQTTMRSEIGKITLDRMFEEREARDAPPPRPTWRLHRPSSPASHAYHGDTRCSTSTLCRRSTPQQPTGASSAYGTRSGTSLRLARSARRWRCRPRRSGASARSSSTRRARRTPRLAEDTSRDTSETRPTHARLMHMSERVGTQPLSRRVAGPYAQPRSPPLPRALPSPPPAPPPSPPLRQPGTASRLADQHRHR